MSADMNPIVNRVTTSGLVSIDLEEYLDSNDFIEIDIKDFLYQEMLLREKDFRQQIKGIDWNTYLGKNVLVRCSVEALIPSWAYMLIVSKLSGVAAIIGVGSMQDLERRRIDRAIDMIDCSELKDAKVVIKGCGGIEQRDYAYSRLTEVMVPLVSSLMYGEPCSTVPVFKRPRK